MSYSDLAKTIMSLKFCVVCGHQFEITKENKAVCPNCKAKDEPQPLVSKELRAEIEEIVRNMFLQYGLIEPSAEDE